MRTISIQTSRPVLDIRSTPAKLEIRNQLRRPFRTTTTRPEMMVERQRPKMSVNWKKVWADRGVRSPEYFRQYTQQNSRQAVQTAIGNIVACGNNSLGVENYIGTSQNPIASWAWDSMMSDIPEMSMDMTAPSPEVEWEQGYMRIDWSPGNIEIEWDEAFMPEISVTPYSVEISLKGQNEVKITVNEERVAENDATGRKVDKRI